MTLRSRNLFLMLAAALISTTTAMAAVRKAASVATGTPPSVSSFFADTKLVVGKQGSFDLNVNDPDSATVSCTFDWGNGTSTNMAATQFSPGRFYASALHAWAAVGTYSVRARATDDQGNVSPWSNTVMVTVAAFYAPSTPSLVRNPERPLLPIEKAYFYAGNVSDFDSSSVTITFDWGDGSTTDVAGPVGSQILGEHGWSAPGFYTVRAKATDPQGHASPWSDALAAVVTTPDTAAPLVPVLYSPSTFFLGGGSVGGLAAEDLDNVKASGSAPSSSSLVQYQFDMGDGRTITTGWYMQSGAGRTGNLWSATGAYSVKARASNWYGAWSAWSAPQTVSVIEPSRITGALAHDTSKGGFGVQAGDRVVLFFNGPTTRYTFTPSGLGYGNLDAYFPVAGKTWGRVLSAVWRTNVAPPGYMGTAGYDGLEITFAGSGTTVAPGDNIGASALMVGGDPFAMSPAYVTLGGSFDRWLRGDMNGDGQFTTSDIVCLMNYVYLGTNPPAHLVNADVNSDGQVTPADIVSLQNYIYLGTPAPNQNDF